MIELSRYACENVRTDQELILYRGRRSSFASASEDKSSILVLAPALEQSELGTLKRLEHEFSLRDELDPEWAVRPIGLTRDWERPALILEDPGGTPLDVLLGDHSAAPTSQPGGVLIESPSKRVGVSAKGEGVEITFFLRVGISLAKAIGRSKRKRGTVGR